MEDKKRDPSRIPGGMWAVICVILSLAVLIGIVAFVVQMGYFDEDFDLNAIPTNQEQTQTDQTQEPEEDAEPEMDEPQEPEKKVCTGLAISQEEVVMDEVGSRVFLTVAITPDDCEDELVYTSSDEDVVTVSDSGMLTAVGSGEAEVEIVCGTFREVCKVVCAFEDPEQTEEQPEEEQTEETTEPEEELPAPVVLPSDFTFFYPGEETYLAVSNVPDGVSVSYVSSNAAVVTVTADGKVTAVGDGTATITITVGDTKLTSIARCNFDSTTEGGGTETNTQNYTGPFTLNYTDVTFQRSGETLKLTLTDSAGKAVSGLSWVSGNSAVCTVSGDTVKAVGRGNTTVSTTYQGTTYSCIIRTGF